MQNLDAYQYNYATGQRLSINTTAITGCPIPLMDSGNKPRYIRVLIEQSTAASLGNAYIALGTTSGITASAATTTAGSAGTSSLLLNANTETIIQVGSNSYFSLVTQSGSGVANVIAIEW